VACNGSSGGGLLRTIFEVGDRVWEPSDLCCYATGAVTQGFEKGLANACAATDAVKEL
jgi:hypothetical protein